MKLGIPSEALPRHVAIIMDGNGRWGVQRGLPRTAGHKAGADTMRRVVRLSSQWGIEVLTLFALSTENWNRPADELKFILDTMLLWLKRETNDLMRNRVRLLQIGDASRLPQDLQRELTRVKERTRENDGLTLCLAINYGGRDEIVRAAKRAMERGVQPDALSEQVFGECLDTAGLPDVDLLIRTSEMRTSGFMLWQSAYAELMFLPGYWPDFDESAYAGCLREYAGRQRRFGGVSP